MPFRSISAQRPQGTQSGAHPSADGRPHSTARRRAAPAAPAAGRPPGGPSATTAPSRSATRWSLDPGGLVHVVQHHHHRAAFGPGSAAGPGRGPPAAGRRPGRWWAHPAAGSASPGPGPWRSRPAAAGRPRAGPRAGAGGRPARPGQGRAPPPPVLGVAGWSGDWWGYRPAQTSSSTVSASGTSGLLAEQAQLPGDLLRVTAGGWTGRRAATAPPRGAQEAHQGPEQGGLAAPVGPDHGGHGAVRDAAGSGR